MEYPNIHHRFTAKALQRHCTHLAAVLSSLFSTTAKPLQFFEFGELTKHKLTSCFLKRRITNSS